MAVEGAQLMAGKTNGPAEGNPRPGRRHAYTNLSAGSYQQFTELKTAVNNLPQSAEN
jgi:hypothetical protein